MTRLTIAELARMATAGERLPMVTCYDHGSALLCEKAGLRFLLVGDSLGQVMLGHPDTLGVTLDDMVRHTAAVVRGAPGALVVADLPFLTYASPDQAVASAKRLLQEGGAQAVKLEGGLPVVDSIRRLVELGVPTMAHLGFTPQSANQIGVRVQGRDAKAAARLIREADAVARAGAFAIVLELVPAELARAITHRVGVPTIGIGAGAGCSGQVQVWHDLLGLSEKTFRHAGHFAEIGDTIRQALTDYAEAVRGEQFPTSANAASIDEAVVAEALALAEHE
jgi:3-methyl-2-oxobutanoate hydroxymethyltransferase